MPAKKAQSSKPRARSEGLLHTRLKDELVIYDMQRNKAHSLNRVATLIWERCDGQTSVPQLCELLAHELPEPVEEQIVWLALQQLERNYLLTEPIGMPSDVISRREAAKRFGKIAGLVLPLIVSAMIPPAVAAGSAANTGSTCTSNSDCTGGTSCQDSPGEPGVKRCF